MCGGGFVQFFGYVTQTSVGTLVTRAEHGSDEIEGVKGECGAGDLVFLCRRVRNSVSSVKPRIETVSYKQNEGGSREREREDCRRFVFGRDNFEPKQRNPGSLSSFTPRDLCLDADI